MNNCRYLSCYLFILLNQFVLRSQLEFLLSPEADWFVFKFTSVFGFISSFVIIAYMASMQRVTSLSIVMSAAILRLKFCTEGSRLKFNNSLA